MKNLIKISREITTKFCWHERPSSDQSIEIKGTINSVTKALMELKKGISGHEAWKIAEKAQQSGKFFHYENKTIDHVNFGDHVSLDGDKLFVSQGQKTNNIPRKIASVEQKKEPVKTEKDVTHRKTIKTTTKPLENIEKNALTQKCIANYLTVNPKEPKPSVIKLLTPRIDKFAHLFKKYFPNETETAMTVGLLESSLKDLGKGEGLNTLNNKSVTNRLKEDSLGIMQINWHAHKKYLTGNEPRNKSLLQGETFTKNDLYDPETNIKIASILRKRDGWRIWTGYRKAQKHNLV